VRLEYCAGWHCDIRGVFTVVDMHLPHASRAVILVGGTAQFTRVTINNKTACHLFVSCAHTSMPSVQCGSGGMVTRTLLTVLNANREWSPVRIPFSLLHPVAAARVCIDTTSHNVSVSCIRRLAASYTVLSIPHHPGW
jgi:hypothetical protein